MTCCCRTATLSRRGVRIRVSTVLLSNKSGHDGDELVYSYSVRMSLLSVEEQRRRWYHANGGDDGDGGGGSSRDGSTGGGGGGGGGEFKPVLSAQLRNRMWIIVDANGKKDEVIGEAVIGEYPLLRARADDDDDDKPFVYESCTAVTPPGTMEGGFTFVEGSIAAPTGPDFFVRCPLFRLEKPEYVF